MKLFATTALMATLATFAFAQSQPTTATTTGSMSSDSSVNSAGLIRTRDITGGTVYTLNEADDEGWEMDWAYADVSENLNEIGAIEDIVLSPSGDFKGIVAEVGGFLDIGDKHVMIEVGDVKLVAVDDKSYAFVTRLNEEQLEEMEGVDEAFWN